MRHSKTKKEKFLRLLLILVFILIFFAALLGILAAIKYDASSKSSESAKIEQPATLSAQSAEIGQNVCAEALVRIPWGRTIVSFDVTPGKDSQLAGTPSSRHESIRWGYSLWKLSAVVHAFRPGQIPDGKMILQLEGGLEKKQELSVILPGFQAKALPVTDKDELVTAGKIEQSGKTKINPVMAAVIGGLALILLLILGLLFRTKTQKMVLIPPWITALKNIGDIRGDLHSGKADAAHALVSLTDVLRSYLEQRFHLRVEHQTTREFLDDLRKGGPLDSRQNLFLKEFLNSADMVKFAKAPADVMAFDTAADRAEALVRETSAPDEEKLEKEGAK